MSSFFYRVFTSVEKNIWAKEIEEFLMKENVGLNPYAVVDEEEADNLDAVPVQIVLCDAANREVAVLEYERVDNSEILPDEIVEFHNFVDEMSPECNQEWVHNKLDATIGCYCFSVSDAGFELANWDRLAILASWLREETQGIEQSDGGQITNEEGDVVLLVPDDEDLDDDYDEDSDDVEFEDAEDDFDDDDDEDDEDEDFEDDEEDEDEDDEDDEEDGVEEFTAAIRVGDKWVSFDVDSEESYQRFLDGEV